jgi:lysophospholipase L1-like esterase
MNDSVVRGVRRVGLFIRGAWLMLGSVLLILLVIEFAYREQADVRSALQSRRGLASRTSPYADSAWYPSYLREYTETFHEHWKPFVYFRRALFNGSLIKVDSAGHRRTVGSAVAPGTSDSVHLFFFGGSTMWGTNLRDTATIASVAMQRLAAAVPEGVTTEVTNFGESGYVSTQEVIELELQLRAGNVPDVVLFYDGINDMAAAGQYGAAGVSQNESNRAHEFEFGRAVSGTEAGAGGELRAAGAIGAAILQRVQFMQRLLAMVARPAAAPQSQSTERLARDVARTYAANAEIVEALSRAYGFRVLYVWQPTLYSTTKKLTPFEQLMLSDAAGNPLLLLSRKMNPLTLALLDSMMKLRFGARFIDEQPLFAGDTSSVFTDPIGHTTEKAVLPIVAGFFPVLSQLVDSARLSRTRARAAPGHGAPKTGAPRH